MSTLKSFFDAAKWILTVGASTNAGCRQEIRDVVGQLSDELDRALTLADSYLMGIRYSRNDQELVQYLESARSKISDSFREHHICSGLYMLADKFGQIFDPTRFSVSLASYQQIPELIQHLKNGERAVLDDLEDMVQHLQQFGGLLYSATPAQLDDLKLDLSNSVRQHRTLLESHRNTIKTICRQVIDTL